jgi:response regulator NasT
MRILIVDDNARVRRLIARVVAPLAAEIAECPDGACAVRAYRAGRPDVVLLDVAMHPLDGLAAARQILDADPAACIVIVTDYDEAELRTEAGTVGVCGYVLKENLFALRGILEEIGAGGGPVPAP